MLTSLLSGGGLIDQELKWCLTIGQLQGGSRTIHISEMLTCSLQVMLSNVILKHEYFLPLLIQSVIEPNSSKANVWNEISIDIRKTHTSFSGGQMWINLTLTLFTGLSKCVWFCHALVDFTAARSTRVPVPPKSSCLLLPFHYREKREGNKR